MKVYLSGGMKGCWQDEVIRTCPENTYFDPRSHKLEHTADYTQWDFEHVKRSDLVFACFAKDNPSGFGMCAEIGFAKALGIRIILVDEKKLPSWDIVRELCVFVTDNIQYGCDYMLEVNNAY